MTRVSDASRSVDRRDTDVAFLPGDEGYWHGAIAWEPHADLAQPWRLLPAWATTADSQVLAIRARMPAGVHCRFDTDSELLELPLDCGADGIATLDVVVADRLHSRVRLPAGQQVVRIELSRFRSKSPRTVEVWLPQSVECAVGAMRVAAASHCTPVPNRGPRWIAYGSSITHCRGDAGPTDTWPAVVARTAGWELYSLGLGSQCQLDAAAAQTICALPADVISLCVGINIYQAATFTERSLLSQLCGFISQIRTCHPHTPIVLSGPLRSPDREDQPNPAGLTLHRIREIVANAVTVLHDLGDVTIAGFDGLEIIHADETDLLADGVHPRPDAYPLIADRMRRALSAALASTDTPPSTVSTEE